MPERIKFVYSELGIKPILISNGLLMAKKIDEYKNLPFRMNMSLYYSNVDDFNKFHGVNASQGFIDEMLSMDKYQNIHVKHESFYNIPINDISEEIPLNTYYSRCGFLNGGKILHKEIKGCKFNRHDKRMHIMRDGNVILCCNDFIKEVVVGNLNYQTIEEVKNSNLYLNVIKQVNGENPSSKDFVCKRCEDAIPKNSK